MLYFCHTYSPSVKVIVAPTYTLPTSVVAAESYLPGLATFHCTTLHWTSKEIGRNQDKKTL